MQAAEKRHLGLVYQ